MLSLGQVDDIDTYRSNIYTESAGAFVGLILGAPRDSLLNNFVEWSYSIRHAE